MRDPGRIQEVLEVIREIWFKKPDLRLLQLLINALPGDKDPYCIEDDLLVDFLEDFYNKDLKIPCKHENVRLIENSVFQCCNCGEIIAEAKIAKMFDITPKR